MICFTQMYVIIINNLLLLLIQHDLNVLLHSFWSFRAPFIVLILIHCYCLDEWPARITKLDWHEIVYIIILFCGWTVTLMIWFIHTVRPSVLTNEMCCSADYFESLVRCLSWLHLLLFLIRSYFYNFSSFERPWRSHSTENSLIKFELLAHPKQKPCVP